MATVPNKQVIRTIEGMQWKWEGNGAMRLEENLTPGEQKKTISIVFLCSFSCRISLEHELNKPTSEK